MIRLVHHVLTLPTMTVVLVAGFRLLTALVVDGKTVVAEDHLVAIIETKQSEVPELMIVVVSVVAAAAAPVLEPKKKRLRQHLLVSRGCTERNCPSLRCQFLCLYNSRCHFVVASVPFYGHAAPPTDSPYVAEGCRRSVQEPLVADRLLSAF